MNTSIWLKSLYSKFYIFQRIIWHTNLNTEKIYLNTGIWFCLKSLLWITELLQSNIPISNVFSCCLYDIIVEIDCKDTTNSYLFFSATIANLSLHVVIMFRMRLELPHVNPSAAQAWYIRWHVRNYNYNHSNCIPKS